METRVLTESDINCLVNIFSKSGDLVLNRERLYLELGLTISELEDIKMTVAMDRSKTHGFLTQGLAKWINNNGTAATAVKLIEVLRKQEFNSVADKISKELPARKGITADEIFRTYDPTSVWFNVPEEVSAFTGRQSEIEGLHGSIMGQNIKKNEQREITVITTLSGLGGIGKTTLAIHYAWKYFRNHFFNVIWINAETTATIEKSLQRLAGKVGSTEIGIDGITIKPTELASRIYEHFQQSSTLFVFDNVEQHEHVKQYLPIKSPKTTKQYVLITSRSRVWTGGKTDLIVLNVFPENDSVEFLKSYLKLENDEEIELAKEIARGLQNLPLAIRQASAYIENEKVCSDDCTDAANVMKRYLELLKTNSQEVLGFKCDTYEKTICSTWKITLEKIKRRNYLAVRIMRITSYFNSDHIPIQLLQNIPEKTYFERGFGILFSNNTIINKSRVLEAVKLLSELSMVTTDSQFNVSVHRLVQKVIRDDVERVSKRKILSEAIRTVKVELNTNAGSDYEQNCLLHGISISMQIHSNRLELDYTKFLDFISSKQNNLIDLHTQRLSKLLGESKYDEAEASFHKCRDEYFRDANGVENVLAQSFTFKFIMCVCRRILTLQQADFTEQDVLKLSELCCRLLVGFNLSFGERKDFRGAADLLRLSRHSTDVIQIQNSLLKTASRMYKILFCHLKYGGLLCSPDDFKDFNDLINGFIYLESWPDKLELVESLFELSVCKYKTARLGSFLRKACDHICEVTTQVGHETNRDVQNQLFQYILKMYTTCYKYYLEEEKYELTLKSGRGRIQCLMHLNMQTDMLEVIADMKLVFDLLTKMYYYSKSTLSKIGKSMVAYSNHPNCIDVKTDLVEFAEHFKFL